MKLVMLFGLYCFAGGTHTMAAVVWGTRGEWTAALLNALAAVAFVIAAYIWLLGARVMVQR